MIGSTSSSCILRVVAHLVHLCSGDFAAVAAGVVASILAIAVGRALLLAAASLGEVVVRCRIRGWRRWRVRTITPLVHLSSSGLTALAARVVAAVLTVAVLLALLLAAPTLGEVVVRCRSRGRSGGGGEWLVASLVESSPHLKAALAARHVPAPREAVAVLFALRPAAAAFRR